MKGWLLLRMKVIPGSVNDITGDIATDPGRERMRRDLVALLKDQDRRSLRGERWKAGAAASPVTGPAESRPGHEKGMDAGGPDRTP